MAHSEQTKKPSTDFPMNQELLSSATRAKEEWRMVKERLGKIESNKSQVSPVVFERVYGDYQAKLREAKKVLLGKKSEVDREINQLQMTQKKIAIELEEHRHALEEIKFRYSLDEFDEGEYQQLFRTAEEKIGKFDSIMSAVKTNLNLYESIFEGEEELLQVEDKEISISLKRKIDPKAKAAKQVVREAREGAQEPKTDDSGYILEENPNYFSETEESTDLHMTAAEKTDETKPEKGSPGKRRPRVVVIDGQDLGATYEIEEMLSFGRAESNRVILRDPKVSRQHSRIQKKGNEYVLTDLNSSNGTYANGERVEEHALSDGDEIQIGDSILQFQI